MTRRFLLLAALAMAPPIVSACASHRNLAAAPGSIELTGKVLHIQDASEVDGPIILMVESERGETVDLYFGSAWTAPSPDAKRRQTFETVRKVRVGDRVRAQGSAMDGGPIWLEQIENLDRK